jgi:hypothetical protein
VIWLSRVRDRREVTAGGMKVRHGGVVNLHDGRMRKRDTVSNTGKSILVSDCQGKNF